MDSVFNQAGAVRNTDTVTRQGGGTLGNEPLTLSAQGQTPVQFSAQDEMPLHVGLNDGDEYPPEPSPGPMPGAPPVPEDHPDMEDYEAETGQYWDEHDAWEDEVESIDKVKEDASVVYISESDYNKQLTELERKLELRQGFVDSYETKMLSTSLTDANYNLYMNGANRNRDEVAVLEKAITELREQRAASAKTDPLFNTTGIISNQNSLGNMPYGSQGTAAGNSCGAVAAHNALVLLGENSDFADVYTYFNDDSKLNLGGLAGGKLGTNPLAVAEYLENEGHEVTFKDFRTEELENTGTYILVYGWQGSTGNISAHFEAVESDGSTVKTYNTNNTYYIGKTNNSGDSKAYKLEDLKTDLKMLDTEKSWLLNTLAGPLVPAAMKLTGDDTYFSYIIAVE